MSVLILGATSPVARVVADEYAQRGHFLVLAARDVDEAHRLAADLRVRHQVEAIALAFDARDTDGHPALIDAVEEAAGPIDAALLAFGYMGVQEVSEHELEEARKVIEVNYTGAASLSEALANRMVERGRGAIVGLASVAGDRGRATNYVYGSAKGAFALYLQGLRNRVAGDGVQVLTVKLGFVDTRMTFGMETPLPVASPEAAGKAIVNAQERGADVIYYPRFWRGVMAVIRAIPERVFKGLSI